METITGIIPCSLPILPLAEYVLLPSIVTTLSICKSDVKTLLKNNTTGYIICVPLATTTKRGNKKNKPVMEDFSQLFRYGCVAKIIQSDHSIPNLCILKVEGICRSRILDISTIDGAQYKAQLEHYPDHNKDFIPEDKAKFESVLNSFMDKMKMIGVSASVLHELRQLLDCCQAIYVANLMLCIINASTTDKLRILEMSDTKQKWNHVNDVVNNYLQVQFNTLSGISIYA